MDDKELLQELEDQAGGPLKCARLLAVDYTGVYAAGRLGGRKSPGNYQQRESASKASRLIGAGNRVRTGDLYLGKVSLYQLSYSRDYSKRSCSFTQIHKQQKKCVPSVYRTQTTKTKPKPPAAPGFQSSLCTCYLGKVALYQLSYTRIKTRVLRSSCIIDQY